MDDRTRLASADLPTGDTAIWERIAEAIRKRIDSGLWGAGQQLLAEEDLAGELRVARGTLRRAIKDLTETGYLVQHRGRGTFVAKRGTDLFANRMESLGERMIRAEVEFETIEISRSIVDDGTELGLGSGGVLVVRRQRSIGGAPVAVLSNALALDHFPGLEHQDLVTRPLYTVLEAVYGETLVRAERTFRAVAADHEIADLLDVPLGSAVLHFAQVTWGARETVVDVAETWIRSDRHQPTVSMWRSI